MCVATTLDGRLLCSGSKDKSIRIYNAVSNQLISATAVHDGAVRCVLFSKSSQLIITGGADFKVKVWFVDDMSAMHVFEEYVTPITAIALTPDTSFLLIGEF
jgi:WD40 repeat protein